MLHSGGGGNYGGTSWAGRSVPDMWLAIGNQETTGHWELLTGWRRSYELTHQHMAAVQRYRENLIAAWPPEKSPAAAAYVAQLDALIANLRQTYDAAVANYTAFSAATLALSSARHDLEKVFAEYVANEGKLAGFEKERAGRPVAAGKSVLPPLKSPVEEGRQAELERQARSIMYGLSAELMQARAQITQPARYTPNSQRAEYEHEGGVAPVGPPPIPPVSSFDPQAGTPDIDTAGVAGDKVSPERTATSSSSGSAISSPPPGPGLVLGGTHPALTVPTPLPSQSHAPGNYVGTLPIVTPPHPLPAGSPANNRDDSAVNRRVSPAGFVRPSSSPAVTPSAMPPGGVIGPVPREAPGQPGASQKSPRHVNPVGGVIGQSSAPNYSGPAAQARSAPIAPFGQTFSRRSPNDEEHNGQRLSDQNNLWSATEGVAPVVAPRPTRPIEPGPAIGLG